MKTYELQSVDWDEDGLLKVSYREKRFYAGSSALIFATLKVAEFIAIFGKSRVPPKAP